MPTKGLRERLKDGEYVMAAEGYLFEFERRGYLKAGPFVPEVVLEHPHLVKAMHEEFVHAGSDVVEAFTYYGHREKLRLIGRENDLEAMNKNALKIARQVADETHTLMAGNICNTTRYDPKDPKSHEEVRAMFKESVNWAVQGGADFIIAETYPDYGEALLALEAIKQYGQGRPSVIMFAQHDFEHKATRDGVPFPEACAKLENHGADVVGLNCSSGPNIMLELMRDIRKATKGPLAALPVPYRTTHEAPQMQSLMMPKTGQRAFPYNLDAFLCSGDDIEEFGNECKKIGIQYVGICCGNSGRYFRRLCETMGRHPPASRYTPDMKLHYIFGTQQNKLYGCNTDTLKGMMDAKTKPIDAHVVGKK